MRQQGFDRPPTTTLASQFPTQQPQPFPGIAVSQQQQPMGASIQNFQSGTPRLLYNSSLVSQGPQSMQPGQQMPTQFQYSSPYGHMYGSAYGPQFGSMPSAEQYPIGYVLRS